MSSCGSGSSSPRPITSPANTASEVRNPSVGVAIPAHVQACAGPAPKLPASTRLLTRATMRRPDLALTQNMTPILLNSTHQLAAVDLDDLADEVVRRRRSQEHNRRNHGPQNLLLKTLAEFAHHAASSHSEPSRDCLEGCRSRETVRKGMRATVRAWIWPVHRRTKCPSLAA